MLSVVAPPTQVSAALSPTQKQQCWEKFGGSGSGGHITRSSLSTSDQNFLSLCQGDGWCVIHGASSVTIGAVYITCSNPSNPDTLQDASSNAASAEVAPLIKLRCPAPTSSGSAILENYIKCINEVRTAYGACDMTGGPITSSTKDTDENTARCIRDRLSNPKPSIQNILAAVSTGRNNAQAIVSTAITDGETERKREACLAEGKEWINNACAEKTSSADACRIDGIGWIICPLITYLTKITDGAYNAAEKLLIFRVPNAFDTDPAKNPLYTLWSSVRNLANIAFVIAFFVVIFSQATSMGISAYGIRKMLPRMVVAAVLVNLSYYLCIFAIDISNIIGAGLGGLISQLPQAALQGAAEQENSWEKLGSNILGFTLVGATAAGVAILATGSFFALLAFSFLAIITAVIIFIARHALIIMLIILSPLAFVAYILPNTENIFDKWKKAFIAMLVMYPLVAILFAGSKVASSIMLITAGEETAGGTAGEYGWIYKIGALAVLAIPLFGIPWIVKFSGGFIGRVAGMVNDRSKGMVDRARKAGDKGASTRRAEAGSRAKTWLRNDAKRGGLDKAAGWGYDADGNKKKGIGAFARRRAGGVISSPSRAGFGEFEREARMSQVKEELQQAREAQLSGSISREEFTDKQTGVFNEEAFMATQRSRQQAASVAARRAAGVGGEEGAKNVQRLAREQSRKRYNENVDRVTGDWISSELMNSTTDVEEIDAQGNVVKYTDGNGLVKSMDKLGMHDRLSAMGAGKRLRYTDSNGNVHIVDGSHDETIRAAAFKRIADTADKKAVAAADLVRELNQDKLDKYNVRVEQEKATRGQTTLPEDVMDKIRDEELGPKGQEILFKTKYAVKKGSSDHALMLNYFGGSQGLATSSPHYRQSDGGAFNSPTQGKVAGFSNEEAQYAIKYYDNRRTELGAQLIEAQRSGNAGAVQEVTAGITANDTAITRFIQFYGQATQNENLVGNMDADAIEKVRAFASRPDIAQPFPSGQVAARVAPPVEFKIAPSQEGAAPTLRTAGDIRAQVAAKGGFSALPAEYAAMTIDHIADPRFTSDPEAAALRAEAEAELRDRGILPPR